tara:strand:+ start:3352 stop:4008 length:657 start_codon:yes stop_codon:yes gene_type:complete
MQQNGQYQVAVEVHGMMALFAAPDSGSESCSYPFPPYSAVKGMFEAIAFLRHARVNPTRIHICEPVRYCDGGINYSQGALRKDEQVKKGETLQRARRLLYDVKYQLFADVKNLPSEINTRTASPSSKKWLHVNHAHSYLVQFNRRLKRSQYYRNVCLGGSEFLATYVGPLLPETKPCEEVSLTVEGMLHHPFDANQFGNLGSRWTKSLTAKEGVVTYA